MPVSRPILEILNEVTVSASIPELPAIFGDSSIAATRPSDETVRRIKSVVNDACVFLSRSQNWQSMWRLAEFTVPAGEKSIPYPPDFDRIATDTLMAKETYFSNLHGPASPEGWRLSQTLTPNIGCIQWRMGQDRLHFNQEVSEDVVFNFEYASSFYVVDRNDRFQARVTNDSDRLAFDDFMVKAELKWRILREFGEPYAEEKLEADTYRKERAVAEEGEKDIRIGCGPRTHQPQIGSMFSNKVVVG